LEKGEAVVYGLKCRCHPGSGVRYVGQTSVGLDVRFSEHIKNSKKPPTDRIGGLPVYRWIRKHGVDNIESVVLEDCIAHDNLDVREEWWIAKLNTFVPNGLNMTRGGGGKRGYHHSPESRAKISASKMGKPSTGRASMSVETVRYIKDRLWHGDSIADLAETGIATSKCIKDISQGKTWNHVPWPIGPRQRMRTSERRSKNHGGSRGNLVTAETVRNIRRAYGMGNLSYREVAESVGVSPSVVRKIIQGRTWKHVE